MRKIRSIVSLIAIALTLACTQPTAAQQPGERPDMTLDAAARAEVIDGVLKKLNDAYVFPEVAKKMEQAVRERVQKKEYDGVTSAVKFAETFTTHLQEVSRDKHLRVNYSHEPIPPETARREPTPEERERFLTFMKSINFGFEKVERLSGNVGYLDLRGFTDAEMGGETVVAAMNFLANTDALIIKNLKRATIVGETTGGGAHPGGPSRINAHFAVWVPRGRAINPISKTNWEGTGVEPDVKVTSEEALKTAHLTAVNKTLEKTADQRRKDQLKDVARTLQKELDELKKNQNPNP